MTTLINQIYFYPEQKGQICAIHQALVAVSVLELVVVVTIDLVVVGVGLLGDRENCKSRESNKL